MFIKYNPLELVLLNNFTNVNINATLNLYFVNRLILSNLL